MTHQNAAVLSLRADLVQQRIQMGDHFVWILKDPLSRAFYYFSDREFSILKLLDGRRRTMEIIAACRERLAPDYVSAEAVISFLADAKQNGLITSSTSGADAVQSSQSAERNQPSRCKNLLAIRFPGINPDRVLDSIAPRLRGFFSPITFVVVTLLGLLATVSVIANFDDFISHVGAAAARSSWVWALAVIAIISITKIVHELAHAVACKAFGAECREIGVMLLVGIPCLFCDVSDAWMLRKRVERIIVSAAGMLAELLIASLATFLWMFSTDGIVRDICVITMIVCSVSTVLFNGNPLLRYDGYFILSDLLAIPNLASESSLLIRSALRRRFWGLPGIMNQSTPPEPQRSRVLATYGVLSGVYRFFVLGLIGLLLYRFTSTFGLGFVGVCLAAAILLPGLWRSVFSVIRPPTAIESRSLNPSRRPYLIGLMVVGLVLLAVLLPLPRSVVAPATIGPSDGVDVFLKARGRLVSAIEAGVQVQQGDEVARFRNDDTERALLALDTKRKTLRRELASLQQRRSFDKQAASRIDSVSEALNAANNDYRQRREEADRLVIRAPRSGCVFDPRNRDQAPAEERDIETWDDTPLQEKNRGSYFEEGTLLCSVGDPIARDAIVLVRQQDIALVRRGQTVELLTATHKAGYFTGSVTEVATSPIKDVPREFFAAALVDPASESRHPGATRETYYQIRVSLKNVSGPIVVRSTGRAKIKVQSASLSSRLIRIISDAFRFQW